MIDTPLIVSMTSWPKRINNCKAVIDSLLNQDIKPNFVELNLSTNEFPCKGESLPENLVEIILDNENVEVNWVKGNNGVFKKIIPTLKKFQGKEYYFN